MRRPFIILFCSLPLVYFSSFAQSPFLKKYSIDDGLASNRIRKIYQDSNGFLWIATWNGLSKYDGNRFTNYGDDEGIFSMINDMIEIKKGKLLVAQNNGVVSSIENGAVKSLPTRKIIINNFIPMPGNKLYVTTDLFGTGEWRNDHFEFIDSSFKQSTEYWVMMNDSLSIYSCSADGINGYLQIVDQKLHAYSLKTMAGIPIIFKDSHQRIWAGTPEGLKLISPHQTKNTSITFTPLPAGFPTLPPPLKTTYITAIIEDSDGNLWFGTDTDGLVIITKEGTVITIDIKNGLPSNDITCLFEDKEKNMWIGTAMGLVKVPQKNKIVLPGNQYQVGTDEIRATIQLADGKILLFRNDIIKLDPLTNTTRLLPDKFNWPNAIFSLGENEVIYSDSQRTVIYNKHDKIILYSNHLYSYNGIRLDSDNLLLVTQSYLMLMSQKNSRTDSFYLTSRIIALAKDKDGYIWLGTLDEGIYKLKITGDRHIMIVDSLREQLPEPNIRSLFFDNDNKLWVGMRYKGVCCLKKKSDGTYHILHYQQKDGLSDNWVRTINEDHDKNIWLGCDDGMDKLIPVGNGYRIFNYGRMNGISGMITSIRFLDDQSILFSGFPSLVHSRDDQLDTVPPPLVFITGIRTGNAKTIFIPDSSSKARVSYKNAQIYFEFSSPQYFNEKQILYSYHLSGSSDTAWSAAANTHSVYYANLRPGKYHFDVRSMGWNGQWGKATSFSFMVSSPFWDKWWFISLVILAVAAALYLLYRYRLYQIVKLQKVRNRIATDLHDEIGSSLTNINILSSLSKKNIAEHRKADEFLNRISEEANASSQALDDIIWSVNTRNDTLEEMVVRMRRYAAELFDATGAVQYHFDTDESIMERKLNMEQRRDVYLIFKESLNNILKHAAATEVFISIHAKNNKLQLQVRDNGKGFDINSDNHRNGLKNLQLRTGRWKGSIKIDSTKNKGTEINIILPVIDD